MIIKRVFFMLIKFHLVLKHGVKKVGSVQDIGHVVSVIVKGPGGHSERDCVGRQVGDSPYWHIVHDRAEASG